MNMKKNKFFNGDLYGKRKLISAWFVWLMCGYYLIFGLVDMYVFKDLTIFVWAFYFGANAASKFAKGDK